MLGWLFSAELELSFGRVNVGCWNFRFGEKIEVRLGFMSIIEGMEGNCVYMHVYINVCVCMCLLKRDLMIFRHNFDYPYSYICNNKHDFLLKTHLDVIFASFRISLSKNFRVMVPLQRQLRCTFISKWRNLRFYEASILWREIGIIRELKVIVKHDDTFLWI